MHDSGEQTAFVSASLGFAAFALVHARCGEDVIEARLDERSVECWCVRCDEARIFESGSGHETTRPARKTFRAG